MGTEDLNYTKRAECNFKLLTIEEFNHSPLKEQILERAEIMFITLTGSSVSGLNDKYSDIDILAVYNNTRGLEVEKMNPGLGDGIHVHVLFVDYQTGLRQQTGHSGLLIQRVSRGLGHLNGKEDFCLYLNPSYQQEYNNFISKKEEKSYYGILSCLKLLESLYMRKDFRPGKFLCNCAYCKMLLNHENIDKDYLMALKRSRYHDLSTEYQTRFEADKLFIRNYVQEHPITDEDIERAGQACGPQE